MTHRASLALALSALSSLVWASKPEAALAQSVSSPEAPGEARPARHYRGWLAGAYALALTTPFVVERFSDPELSRMSPIPLSPGGMSYTGAVALPAAVHLAYGNTGGAVLSVLGQLASSAFGAGVGSASTAPVLCATQQPWDQWDCTGANGQGAILGATLARLAWSAVDVLAFARAEARSRRPSPWTGPLPMVNLGPLGFVAGAQGNF